MESYLISLGRIEFELRERAHTEFGKHASEFVMLPAINSDKFWQLENWGKPHNYNDMEDLWESLGNIHRDKNGA